MKRERFLGKSGPRVFLVPTLFLVPSLAAISGCGGEQKPEPTPMLAEAAADEKNVSASAENNVYAQAQPNLLSRTIFQSEGPNGVAIEFRDILILPGKTADHISLPGAAVLDVRAGQGKLTLGDKSMDLAPGAIVSVNSGQEFTIECAGEIPLELRAKLFLLH